MYGRMAGTRIADPKHAQMDTYNSPTPKKKTVCRGCETAWPAARRMRLDSGGAVKGEGDESSADGPDATCSDTRAAIISVSEERAEVLTI